MSTSPSSSTFSFTLTKVRSPRLGSIFLRRPDVSLNSQLPTPTFLTTTSRGVIPHLSKDNQRLTPSIRWVNVPFETFMEHNPPVPTLHPGKDPLHEYLGFTPGKQVVSMSARDPDDGREMPPNGKTSLSVCTLRGVRKLSPVDWRSYSLTCRPDVVIALSDIPFTDPPYSQKRLTKSIERSTAWLTCLIRPVSPLDKVSTTPSPSTDSQSSSVNQLYPPSVLVHMAGGASIPARRAFASSLLEPLYGPEATLLAPLKSLDEGVVGYTFDLKPLRQSITAAERKETGVSTVGILPPTNRIGIDGAVSEFDLDSDTAHSESIVPLLEASLAKLPHEKIRVLNSTEGPHEILKYITEVGVDVFDAGWAQRAADHGIGLDFEFPVREGEASDDRPKKRDIGHNFYDPKYSFDFGTISDCFRGGRDGEVQDLRPICPCAACSPLTPDHQISHGVDTPEYTLVTPTLEQRRPQRHHSRAYIHHLLHTHEMSAHALLVMHNLAVLSQFFEGIRDIVERLSSADPLDDKWAAEVQGFFDRYEMGRGLFAQARKRWREVDLARGKGRLAREREREDKIESVQSNLS